ncbi:hypothetical protein THASP1DRAFT_31174, partial [Thamnocephalis sphaerospora]
MPAHHDWTSTLHELVAWLQLLGGALVLLSILMLPGMPSLLWPIRRLLHWLYALLRDNLSVGDGNHGDALTGRGTMWRWAMVPTRRLVAVLGTVDLWRLRDRLMDAWFWLADELYASFFGERARHAPIRGLVNTGNSCFLNSVLQSMAATPTVMRFLEDMAREHALLAGPADNGGRQRDTAHTLAVSMALLDTLTAINEPMGGPAAFRPRKLTQTLAQHRRVVNREQQDAQEFFQILSATLTREAALANERASVTSLLDVTLLRRLAHSALPPVVGAHDTRRRARQRNPFSGLLASRISCVDCGYTGPIRHFPFDNLSLSPPTQFSCSLSYCLEQYIKMETLDDFSCRRCSLEATAKKLSAKLQRPAVTGDAARTDKIQKKLVAVEKALRSDVEAELTGIRLARVISAKTTKQVMVAQPPPVLCLHISRSTFTAHGDLRKNTCWVRFPLRLNLASCCTDGQLNLRSCEPLSGRTADVNSSTGATWAPYGLAASALNEKSVYENDRRHGKAPATSVEGEHEHGSPPVWYRLRALVAHYGGHHYGHFVAYRRAAVAVTPSLQQDAGPSTAMLDCSDEASECWYR